MAILANRVRVKNHLAELVSFALYLTKRFFSILLIICSLYILYFPAPKFLSNFLLETGGNILSVGTLIHNQAISSAKWLNNRFSYFKELETDYLKLKTELNHLQKQVTLLTNLEIENQKLKKLLKMREEVTEDFITAKIISTTNNHLASAMMVAAGAKDGVKINDLVLGEKGLIGRINQVSKNYANILLITDPSSHIPIITKKSENRGIIAKQHDQLQLIYLADDHQIELGELIYSSGDGQIFPKNLPIATVTDLIDDQIIITPLEKIHQLDHVIIKHNPLTENK